ncbi:hypothetical protein [Oceanicola sp. S124]|uniref:hypothetical protein n=1 Tax=Oceanicola sp. S124 TaxID=1042378 RepID=UPI0002557A16|nr:hypothetical protein [Oceanicola sp. S124]
MATSEFDHYAAPMGAHRLLGQTPQGFLDGMSDHRWARRVEKVEVIAAAPSRGIIADGAVTPGL